VRVLATLLRPDAGHARVLGADVVSQGGLVRERIGLTGQYAALDDYLTGRANLVMIGQLGRLTRRQAQVRADELLDRFGLSQAAGRAVKTYSVLKEYATGPVQADAGAPQLTAQIVRRDGITTEVVRALDAAGVEVTSVTVQQPTLDDVFLTLTAKPIAGGAAA
jgi:ABC-type multidrug transport system ATPase subunit